MADWIQSPLPAAQSLHRQHHRLGHARQRYPVARRARLFDRRGSGGQCRTQPSRRIEPLPLPRHHETLSVSRNNAIKSGMSFAWGMPFCVTDFDCLSSIDLVTDGVVTFGEVVVWEPNASSFDNARKELCAMRTF